MNKTCIIIGREFSTRVRKKSFLVVTLVVPILMALFYAFLMWILLKDDTQERKIAVVNHSAIEAPFHQINNTTFETIDTEVTEASAPELAAELVSPLAWLELFPFPEHPAAESSMAPANSNAANLVFFAFIFCTSQKIV